MFWSLISNGSFTDPGLCFLVYNNTVNNRIMYRITDLFNFKIVRINIKKQKTICYNFELKPMEMCQGFGDGGRCKCRYTFIYSKTKAPQRL